MLDPQYLLEMIGISAFAITGVLAGAKREMDLLSIVVIGTITALGGGTMRDVIIGHEILWIEDPMYAWVAIASSIVTFFLFTYFHRRYRWMLYLDAVGMAVFNVTAIERTLEMGHPASVAILMGVTTAIAGSIIRDVLTGAPNTIIKRELTATPPLVAGAAYVAITLIVPSLVLVASTIAVGICVTLRIGSIERDWRYPDWLSVTSDY